MIGTVVAGVVGAGMYALLKSTTLEFDEEALRRELSSCKMSYITCLQHGTEYAYKCAKMKYYSTVKYECTISGIEDIEAKLTAEQHDIAELLSKNESLDIKHIINKYSKDKNWMDSFKNAADNNMQLGFIFSTDGYTGGLLYTCRWCTGNI